MASHDQDGDNSRSKSAGGEADGGHRLDRRVQSSASFSGLQLSPGQREKRCSADKLNDPNQRSGCRNASSENPGNDQRSSGPVIQVSWSPRSFAEHPASLGSTVRKPDRRQIWRAAMPGVATPV
jgi:hypothetical protein